MITGWRVSRKAVVNVAELLIAGSDHDGEWLEGKLVGVNKCIMKIVFQLRVYFYRRTKKDG